MSVILALWNMVVHACGPRPLEVEEGEWAVPGQPGLHS